MALPPLDEHLRASIEYRDNDNNISVNTFFFYDGAGPPGPSRANDLAIILDVWLSTSWVDVAGSFWTATKINVTGLDANEPAFVTRNVAHVGGVSADPLPNNVTIAVTHNTGVSGKSYRGRTYHIGLTETMVSINDLVAPWTANIPGAYYQMRADALAGDFVPVVMSYYHNKALRTVPVATPVVSYTLADNIVDTQRRRLPRN